MSIYIKDETDNFVKKDITEIIKTANNTPAEQEIRFKCGENFIKTRLAVEKVPMEVELKRRFRPPLTTYSDVSILVLMEVELKQTVRIRYHKKNGVSILVLMEVELKHQAVSG